MKFEAIRGIHGVVLEVADPAREGRLWAQALGLPVLRRRRGEVVLGSLSLFVVLRKTRGSARPAEVHVAVDGLKGRLLVKDALGGRHAAREMDGVRLVVRELTDPPSRAWVGRRRTRRPVTVAGRPARESRGD